MEKIDLHLAMRILLLTSFLFGSTVSLNAAAELSVSPIKELNAQNQGLAWFSPSDQDSSFQISPDNTRVVYSAVVTGSSILQLFSVPIDGGEVVELTAAATGNVFEYKISPDGNWVMYRGANGLNIVPILGGATIRLDTIAIPVDSGKFEFTFNSSHVVYLSTGSLWSIGVDGSNRTHLNVNQPAALFDVSVFDLSPNNTTVIFPLRDDTNSAHLFSVEVGSTTLSDLIADTSNIESFIFNDSSNSTGFNADGTRIICSVFTVSGFYLTLLSIPATGGVPVPLSPVPTAGGGSGPYFLSSDGASLVFSFGDSFPKKTIYSVNITTGTRTTVFESSDTIGFFGRSPINDKVVFSTVDESEGEAVYYAVSVDDIPGLVTLNQGNEISPIPSMAAVAPDGNSLIWSYTEPVSSSFQHEIYRARLNGSASTLIKSTVDNRESGFIPDFKIKGESDRLIYLDEDFNDPSYGIFAASLDDGQLKEISGSNLFYDFYELSDDGQYVVFVAKGRELSDPVKLYSAKLVKIESDLCFVVKASNGAVVSMCL